MPTKKAVRGGFDFFSSVQRLSKAGQIQEVAIIPAGVLTQEELFYCCGRGIYPGQAVRPPRRNQSFVVTGTYGRIFAC
jgi:hypothetical protein